MTTSIKIVGWLLFTISAGGNQNTSVYSTSTSVTNAIQQPGPTVSTATFPTKSLCDDGASLALWGETVIEKRASDTQRDAENFIRKLRQDSEDANPQIKIREPSKSELEAYKDIFKDAKARKTEISLGQYYGDNVFRIDELATPSGKISEQRVQIVPQLYDPPQRVALARCFPIPEEPRK